MTFSLDLLVVEIVADFDPQGNEYTKISFGFKLPMPRPPNIEQMYPPPPKPTVFKHGLHVFIPREKWIGQYTMWQEFHCIVKDNGEVELKKKETV